MPAWCVSPVVSRPRGGVCRSPFYLPSQGQSLFAWLHGPGDGTAFDHGVLICPPVGYEQVHAHRSLRHLADALAEAGFPVVRLDYHGTGDSPGSADDPGRLATWVENVRDGRSWLEEHLGCTRVSLVGLRLGATLAAQATTDRGVDGLLLWAPVVRGRTYVRELQALSRTSAGPPAESAAVIEAGGFVLSEAAAEELRRLDLLRTAPHCRRALLLTRDDLPADTELLKHLRAAGIDADQTAQPGYTDMMAEPHYGKVPQQAIDYAVAWLRAAEMQSKFRIAERRLPFPGGDLPVVSALCGRQVREHPLTVAAQPHLFGILSEPTVPAPFSPPHVVMLNAGSAYRVGPNRLYVGVARQLAARGFPCLRLDLCGLGDSVAADAAGENDPYPATAFRDIALTLSYLKEGLGAQRVVLLGLCSGAYAAFQAAAQLADAALVESVLINPLTFYWREGMTLEASPARQVQSFLNALASARQPRKWLQLLTGQSKLGLAGALRLLIARWQRFHRAPTEPSALHDSAARSYPSHAVREDLPGDLRRVATTGRHLAFFFAESDPGRALLTLHGGRQVKEMRRAGTLSLTVLENADHTFSRRAAREALGRALAEYLKSRYADPGG
jgi:pimeloyl-ACP methyl ester carboxylesterase